MINNVRKFLGKLKLYLKIQIKFEFNSMELSSKKIDCKLWKKKFVNLLKTNDDRFDELLTEFTTCKMEKIKHNEIRIKSKYSPILFCVIRNDINKIEYFMDYYRKLGIECFVFLDNDSDDGTRQFICEQKDTIVYQSKQQYSSARRVAWLNRLLAIYGQDRWCMIVDSDEFVNFIGSEKYKLTDIVKIAVSKKYKRIEGFLLDMYPKGNLFGMEESGDFFKKCIYFDADTYKLSVGGVGLQITGGPRKRKFDFDCILSKYPLFYFEKDMFVASSHYIIPFEKVRKCPVWFAVCHYKFIDEKDMEKIKEAVKKGNYAGNSIFYKKYLDVINSNGEIEFYKAGLSVKFENSDSLKKIKFIRNVF